MMTEYASIEQSRTLEATKITDRQRAILRMIVHEFVSTGKPVGSRVLIERNDIGVSSATIRNEMVELEQWGLIEHLHTSGGRVPTSLGYRYFVQNLMGRSELPAVEKENIRQLFRKAEVQLEAWTDLAAAVLAEIAGNVSVVTAPRTAVARLRHLELISLQPNSALLILVTFQSTVRQVMVHLTEIHNQDELSSLADTLTQDLRGLSGEDIRSRGVGTAGLVWTVVTQIEQTLRGLDQLATTEVSSSGLGNMVGQPGIDEAALQALIEVTRQGEILHSLIPLMGTEPNVQVFIGDEMLPDQLKRFGLILSPYGTGGEVSGILGVLGPTRMSYWRSISTVRYMARLMSDLVADLCPAVD